jgi:hypothetical protein
MLARRFTVAVAAALGVGVFFLYPKLQSSANLDTSDAPRAEPATARRTESGQQSELPARQSTRADASVRQGPISASDRLNEAEDFGEMIRSLARPAFDGDPDAQALIARALHICLSVFSIEEPEMLPNRITERSRKNAARCKSLKTLGPFSDLPPREGGYPFEYWLERAADSGDPVALALRVQPAVAQAQADSRDAVRAGAQSDLLTAARAKDPEAFFYIGLALLSVTEEDAGVRGVAWVLLACRKVKCGEIPEPVFFAQCPPGLGKECDQTAAVLQQFETDLGPNRHARATALSYEIEDAIEKGLWEQLDLRL